MLRAGALDINVIRQSRIQTSRTRRGAPRGEVMGSPSHGLGAAKAACSAIGSPNGGRCETQLSNSTTSVSLGRGGPGIGSRDRPIPFEAADEFAAAGIACLDDGSARAATEQAFEQFQAQRPNRTPSTEAAQRAPAAVASDEIFQRAEGPDRSC